MKAIVILAVLSSSAHAERPFHGSAGVGGAFLLTGDRGDRFRGELELDIKPRSRLGGLLAWRAFDRELGGLVLAGLVYEGAAARPRLVLDLHGEVGWDLDSDDPVVGGGLRTTLGVIGPLAVILDTGLFVALDGIDDSRVQLQSSTLVGGRF